MIGGFGDYDRWKLAVPPWYEWPEVDLLPCTCCGRTGEDGGCECHLEDRDEEGRSPPIEAAEINDYFDEVRENDGI
jgi:hypothetical protein